MARSLPLMFSGSVGLICRARSNEARASVGWLISSRTIPSNRCPMALSGSVSTSCCAIAAAAGRRPSICSRRIRKTAPFTRSTFLAAAFSARARASSNFLLKSASSNMALITSGCSGSAAFTFASISLASSSLSALR